MDGTLKISLKQGSELRNFVRVLPKLFQNVRILFVPISYEVWTSCLLVVGTKTGGGSFHRRKKQLSKVGPYMKPAAERGLANSGIEEMTAKVTIFRRKTDGKPRDLASSLLSLGVRWSAVLTYSGPYVYRYSKLGSH